MKYRCTHCNHTFELSERDFQRCPNCFWTTALVPVGVGSETSKQPKEVNIPQPIPSASASEHPRLKLKVPILVFLGVVVLGLVVGSVVMSKNSFFEALKFRMLFFLGTKQAAQPPEPKKESPPKKITAEQFSKTLSKEEKAQLSKPFEITIPRQISSDEEEILKKQVSLPAKLSEKPVISRWKKEDFEKMLSTEQKNRKIDLGWSYQRSLVKLFDKNYSAALKAFDQGDYTLARARFIDSLSFPVYHNNRQLHRAVVLVLLRPFINDVIGKIAILNQYLLGQSYLSEVNAIYASYQGLFPVLELQEWDKAFNMISELKNKINAFEQKPKDQIVSYPSSFATLDPELQNAIQTEAAPKPDAAINLKALAVDLNLKENVVRSNTAAELAKIQKQYQQALSLVEDGNLEEARSVLKSIEFPPELVEDVKAKLEIVEKVLAVNNSNQKSGRQ